MSRDLPNLNDGAGVEEDEEREWEKRFLEVLEGDLEEDLGGVAGGSEALDLREGEVGSEVLFSLSLSFLKMWASWTIGGR